MTTDTRSKRLQRAAEPIADLMRSMREDYGLAPRLTDDAFWTERERALEAQRKAEVEREIATRRATRARLLCAAGFPAVHVDAAMEITAGGERAKATAALERAEDFARDRRTSLELAGGVGLRSSLVLAGGVGAGKTTAATWLELMGTDPVPAFVRATALERLGRYESKIGDLLRESTSLVIDDLGAEPLDSRGSFEALLSEVIDVFYGNRRPLVITCNMRVRRADDSDPPQFRERYGERVYSRLREAGKWADCGAVDLRGAVRA